MMPRLGPSPDQWRMSVFIALPHEIAHLAAIRPRSVVQEPVKYVKQVQ